MNWDNEDLFGFKICSEEGRGQIDLTSTLGKIIFDLASKSENKILVEIGTWNGLGSTKCFIEGLLINKESRLFSIENNQEKIDFARKIWTPFIQENNLNVEFLNGTLVPNHVVDKWLLENNVELSPDQLRWLQTDKKNSQNVLNLNLKSIDVLLLDGSDFSSYLEFLLLKDISKYVVLDDVNELKNKNTRQYLLNSSDFEIVTEDLKSRHGYSVFKRRNSLLIGKQMINTIEDFIYLNNISKIHDGKKIFFCKTDYLFQEFEYIKSLDHPVILITGNSDYHITDDLVARAPKNIKKWFAENAISNSEILEPIPIGLENTIDCQRKGHGEFYKERGELWIQHFLNLQNIEKVHGIYANFRVGTNPYHRSQIELLCRQINHIFFESHSLDLSKLENFLTNVKKYSMTICPAGNGVDTHRLWEVLICGGVPITFKMGDFKIYELYEKLPIIVLDDPNKLHDIEYINNEYSRVTQRKNNFDLLKSKFWEDMIITTSNTI